MDIFALALFSLTYLFLMHLINWLFYLESVSYFGHEQKFFFFQTFLFFYYHLFWNDICFSCFYSGYGLCPILNISVFIQMLWLCQIRDKHFCVIWLGNSRMTIFFNVFFCFFLLLFGPFFLHHRLAQKDFIVEDWKGRIEKRPYW